MRAWINAHRGIGHPDYTELIEDYPIDTGEVDAEGNHIMKPGSDERYNEGVKGFGLGKMWPPTDEDGNFIQYPDTPEGNEAAWQEYKTLADALDVILPEEGSDEEIPQLPGWNLEETLHQIHSRMEQIEDTAEKFENENPDINRSYPDQEKIGYGGYGMGDDRRATPPTQESKEYYSMKAQDHVLNPNRKPGIIKHVEDRAYEQDEHGIYHYIGKSWESTETWMQPEHVTNNHQPIFEGKFFSGKKMFTSSKTDTSNYMTE
jgi:hypothetical protein